MNHLIDILAVVWERVGAVVAACMQSGVGMQQCTPMQGMLLVITQDAASRYHIMMNGIHPSAATCPGSVFTPVRWVSVEAVRPQISRCAQLCCR